MGKKISTCEQVADAALTKLATVRGDKFVLDTTRAYINSWRNVGTGDDSDRTGILKDAFHEGLKNNPGTERKPFEQALALAMRLLKEARKQLP